MKKFWLALLPALCLAAPQPQGINENAATSGRCNDVIFVFARGATDYGNMGSNIGPNVCSILRSRLRNVGCQGVGGAYTAQLAANAVPITGTSHSYVVEAERMLRLAARCPNTQVVAGGYSLGAAVMAEAIAELDAQTKNRVRGVILYGWLEDSRNRGQIPGFSPVKTKIFCSNTDPVCGGRLVVNPAHFLYQVNGDPQRGANFLIDRVSRY